jgi:hypothetical protein
VQNYANLVGAWTIIGEQVQIKPAMAAATTAQFYYITNKIVKDKDGVPKTTFTADDDVFRLDERVLKLGMIWQWKANKGRAYSEDMATFEDAWRSLPGRTRVPTSSPSAEGGCHMTQSSPFLG